MGSRRWMALAGVTALLTMGACGGDDGGGGGGDAVPVPGEGGGDAPPPGGGGGGGGELVFGDETITLDSSLCYLQEQDAAAGGGTIELTAQASGTDAAGEDVTVDFTRYSAESQFAGDDVSVDVGDVMSGESISYGNAFGAGAGVGTVTRDGNTVTGEGLTLTNSDDGSEVSASFRIDC